MRKCYASKRIGCITPCDEGTSTHMSIEVAYSVTRLSVDCPAKILLDGSCRCTVRLLAHDGFISHDAGLCELGTANAEKSPQTHSKRRGGACLGSDIAVPFLWAHEE